MEEAIAAGKATAVINSGFIAEPGTGVFLADVEDRSETEAITAEVVESGVDIILGGGETDYLPDGTVGFFGERGTRTDGRNLVEEAEEMGYTVVYTEEQLRSLPEDTDKVLGIFAASDTYNDTTEETNAEERLDNYGQPGNEDPPTVAEMLDAALPILSRDEDGFFAVLEEEGTDNFGNNNNGRGVVEAAVRADEAIGVALDYVENERPNTLLITSADSNAGGVQAIDVEVKAGGDVGTVPVNPTLEDRSDAIEVPLDGQEGRSTEPFIAGPDENGNRFPYGIAYAGLPDFGSDIVSKAAGLNSDLLPSTHDNTTIYRLMYQTLFGEALPSPVDEPGPQSATPATQEKDLPSSHENTFIYDIMYQTLFGQNSLPNLIDGTPEGETLLGGTERDLIRASEGDDTLAGSVNDDILYGEVGNDLLRGDLNTPHAGGDAGGDDFLFGGLGDDRLFGQGGNDQLTGDEGEDRLFGDAGTDLLVGGSGFDTLTGGEGQDTFALSSQAEHDTITDFQIGEDSLAMTGALTFENLTFTQVGNRTVIGSNVEIDLAILNGVNANELVASADSTFITL